MNVIFCDIDGTINPITYRGEDDFDGIKLEILSDICTLTNSSLVLTSSWKLSGHVEKLKERFKILFAVYDIDFLGFTPDVPNPNRAHGGEMWKEWDIAYYLYLHPEVEHYCILDDEDYDLQSLKDKLVKVDYNTGITFDYVDEITKKMNK